MKPHKRNGREAKLRRQESAKDRRHVNHQFFANLDKMNPNERLILAIFGSHEECADCSASKLVGTDCMSPHCKELRRESSVFYDEVTEDRITIRGATMEAGVDY